MPRSTTQSTTQECRRLSPRRLLSAVALCSLLASPAGAFLLPSNHPEYEGAYLTNRILGKRTPAVTKTGPPPRNSTRIPFKVTNNCGQTLWPAVFTQAGVGPGTGGFELPTGMTAQMHVGPDWAGRFWGRTNCTVSGDSCACETGDCAGKLDCDLSGAVPATLVEFHLSGGVNNRQTFYDISLVDGYNLPVGIVYLPSANTTYIPPNLVNAACIATPGWLWPPARSGSIYSNSTYLIPWESTQTNPAVRDVCPWPLLKFPPSKPGDGVYPYPDDDIYRPDFSPCLSACASSGSESDCCTGRYHDPDVCKPSQYSRRVKAACPDAYSFAFDDQSSTFIIPQGGGFEIVFCPKGRSTNILNVLFPQLAELAASGGLSQKSLDELGNATYIETHIREDAAVRFGVSAWSVACVLLATALAAM